MKHNPIFFVERIIESINLIEDYTKGFTREDFTGSIKLQDLIIRRLEIIGEAVKNLPESFRKENSEIEWKKYAGIRDKLIHHYFGIDLKLTWRVIEKDLPFLKNQIQMILDGDKNQL